MTEARTSTTGEPLLDVAGLKTSFETPRGLVRAVDGVDLQVRRGEAVAVVGESGSGKSVLSRSVMGLLPDRITRQEGTVRFRGRDLGTLSKRERQQLRGDEMAMIFQDPMTSLNPVVRIGRQLTEGMRHHRDLSAREARDRAVRLLGAVGIPEATARLRAYPHELSGGMRQRVTIAAALACDPDLLIADEPTTALDVTVQAQILNLLDAQRAERDMALVLVTHDFGVAAGRTDRIAVMYAGRVVETAPTRRLFAAMRHPYTGGLLASIPRLDDPPRTRLPVVPGRPPDLVHRPPGCAFAPRCANAQPRCLEEDPPLTATDAAEHRSACFYPLGTPEGDEARDRNAAAGRTAAGLPVATDTMVR